MYTKFYIGTFLVLCIFMSIIKIISMEAVKVKNKNQLKPKQNGEHKPLPSSIKYILQWTPLRHSLFVDMGYGQATFKKRKCRYTNCFVTHDRKHLGGDYTRFDMIAFHGWDLNPQDLPKNRSLHQKYVFICQEPSYNSPVCADIFDGFFNWTWTYKLNSDRPWTYMIIRDWNGNVVGPSINMDWINNMQPISKKLKKKLDSKTKAAAWFVTNCNAKSGRGNFVKEVQKELQKYKLTVDVYGGCGPYKCSRYNRNKCLKMLEKDYYFYFSFENSFCEDYVTEKLLHPLQYNTVPVVFGAADYSRFMPDGIYLNARVLGPQVLARTMHEIIQDKNKYYSFFKWKKYYSYDAPNNNEKTDHYCRMCAALNQKGEISTVHENFRNWWNPKTENRC